jgi:DNA invertase Pin-like site-specific DNA recombinase
VSEKRAGFKSLADPMIDTTSAHGKLIIAVLGALAEFERSMIVSRTDEGRRRAQARGVKFGRKPKLSQFQIAERWRVEVMANRWRILEGATEYRTRQLSRLQPPQNNPITTANC